MMKSLENRGKNKAVRVLGAWWPDRMDYTRIFEENWSVRPHRGQYRLCSTVVCFKRQRCAWSVQLKRSAKLCGASVKIILDVSGQFEFDSTHNSTCSYQYLLKKIVPRIMHVIQEGHCTNSSPKGVRGIITKMVFAPFHGLALILRPLFSLVCLLRMTKELIVINEKRIRSRFVYAWFFISHNKFGTCNDNVNLRWSEKIANSLIRSRETDETKESAAHNRDWDTEFVSHNSREFSSPREFKFLRLPRISKCVSSVEWGECRWTCTGFPVLRTSHASSGALNAKRCNCIMRQYLWPEFKDKEINGKSLNKFRRFSHFIIIINEKKPELQCEFPINKKSKKKGNKRRTIYSRLLDWIVTSWKRFVT